MHERDGFAPFDGLEDLRKDDVRLREVDGRLQVFPRVQPLFAIPPRPRRPPVVNLVPGQWVRWQLNYRFSRAAGVRGWSYWLDTFNTPELPVTLDMPGKVADFLRATELEPAERAALDQGVTVRRDQGYTLRVSTTRAVHRQLLARCQPLDGGQGTPTVPAQRKARREYENRVSALIPTGP